MDVLVTVASKHGATAEIGEMIAKELIDRARHIAVALGTADSRHPDGD